MDLDALGLNSTFESTALEGSYEPQVDRVDTSDVEGPDDFTTNMTYWMTADLQPGPVKSRKEAKGSQPATSAERQAGEDGLYAGVEASTAASPTVRVNGTTASREYSTAASERSMENDEKVRSFLSALPDTELDHLPSGTPRRAPRQSLLQVPRSSPPKARSLQATVEDSDTPRKPTQQTVIHHPEATPSEDRVAKLQARLDQHELASRTRITELETILTYTRSELEAARNENYKHKDNIAGLERSLATDQKFTAERTELQTELATVQSRADTLQADLARATAEAKAAREESQVQKTNASDDHLARIAYLETHLQDTRFSLECAQADVAAKAQLFQANLDLNANLRALRSELETQRGALSDLRARKSLPSTSDSQLRSELTTKDQLIAQHITEKDELERQLSTAQGRITGLETSLTALRAQLADVHRESGSARTDVERLSHDLEDANDRLTDAQTEADRRVADVEKKLAKMKDLKTEAESKFRELKSQHDDLIEGHEAMLEDVRDKAEDAVRKTGALLAQERKERSRLKKDVERMQDEMEQLRAGNERNTVEDDESDDTTRSRSPSQDLEKAKEIEDLRAIIKNQVAEMKTLKSSHATLLKDTKLNHDATLATLRAEMSTLQRRLDTQSRDHEAINAAMDEQLSHLLSKLMKERARTVVGKRDGQWEEVQRGASSEKELLGKVLMRQWGREECGIAEEKKGQKQVFEYKYIKRER